MTNNVLSEAEAQEAQIRQAMEWTVLKTQTKLPGDTTGRRLIVNALFLGRELERTGQSAPVIIAGYLSGMLSYGAATLEAIREEFGSAVADLVEATEWNPRLVAAGDFGAADADVRLRAQLFGADAIVLVTADYAVGLRFLEYFAPEGIGRTIESAREMLALAEQHLGRDYCLVRELRHSLAQAEAAQTA